MKHNNKENHMTSTKLNLADFDKVYTLMQQNFPIDEFRTYKHQKSLLDNPNYQILVLYTKNNEIKAFFKEQKHKMILPLRKEGIHSPFCRCIQIRTM